MDLPTEFLSKMNVENILVMAAMLWFMNSRIDKKFEKIEIRLEKIENRLCLLENDMIEVKTILRLKECCMIKDESQLKKAE
jgi:hypothetical protein